MKVAVLGMVLCAGSGVLAAEDIYVNAPAGPETGWWWFMHDFSRQETASAVEAAGGSENEARLGQMVTFAGTNRFLTLWEAWVYFPAQASGTRSARLIASIHEVGAGGLPGAVIWSGMAIAESGPGADHAVPVMLTPNVVVPNSVVITFEYDSVVGEAPNSGIGLGVYLNSAQASVGMGSSQILTQDSTSLQWAAYPASPNSYFVRSIMRAEAGPPCYANCDGSTAQPVLNLLDFNCFLNRFSAGDAYANCDGSTAPPVLNVLDFNCFLNRFAQGCP
jgi:hypothetical protein